MSLANSELIPKMVFRQQAALAGFSSLCQVKEQKIIG
jgi:hypothetical protein